MKASDSGRDFIGAGLDEMLDDLNSVDRLGGVCAFRLREFGQLIFGDDFDLSSLFAWCRCGSIRLDEFGVIDCDVRG